MTTVLPSGAPSAGPIPGPDGHPLLGIAPQFRRNLLGSLLSGLHEHGDVVAYRIGPRGRLGRALVAAFHPDDVHTVLTGTEKQFGRATAGFRSLADVIGQGVLTTEGETWLRQRRTLQPLFTPRRVASYAELMTAEADRILADPRFCDGTVDLHQLTQRYAFRVLGRAIFGEDIDGIVNELDRLVPYGADLIRARALSLVRLPLHRPTPRNRALVGVRRRLDELVDNLIARCIARGEGDDLVSRLHLATDTETGQGLSTQEIRDQVLIFLLAGQETTSGALTFTLHQLGRHPDLQDEIVADPALARAAIMEGMRLYPPVYMVDRIATRDTELGGHRISAGTTVFTVPWVTHRHPEFWPRPEVYDLHRFVGEHDRPRYAYFPFGGGPRACMGEHFALLETTVLLQALLARRRVTALDEHPSLTTAIALRPGLVRGTLSPR